MLELVNVTKIYNNNGILNSGLHNVSLKFDKDEIVAIVGESGSGKSTLLNVITKMDMFDEGEIYYKGNETSYFDVNDNDNFRKNKVGFIFQDYNIIDSYTVLENVMLSFQLKGISDQEAKEKAIEILNKVGLSERIHNRGSQLSGGEKQRCVIARALASDCEILACDEPTGNLDSKTGKEIIQLIKDVSAGKLVLIVTHNFDEVKDICTRKIKVFDGQIIEDEAINPGTPTENEELDLDYVPLKEKTVFKVAKKNLLSTPKKTILVTLIFMFICLFALSLYQYIYYSNVTLTNNNVFLYSGNNKLIVYKYDHSEIDLNDIKAITNDYIVNPFYETSTVYIEGISEISHIGYEHNPTNLILDGGRMPENEKECVLLVDNVSVDDPSSLLGVEFTTESNSEFPIKIVGYQVRSDISCVLATGNKWLENYIRVSSVFDYYFEAESKDGFDFYYVSPKYTSQSSTSYLILPISLQDNYKISKYVNEYYDIEFDFNTLPVLRYSNDYDEIGIYIAQDYIDKLNEKAYEVSIYVKNTNDAGSKLASKGYSTMSVKTYTSDSKLMTLINKLSSYAFMAMASIVILILYFISYVVLSKIYQSKTKDYTILRTLGISKLDMKKVVNYEVLSIAVFSTIFIYVVLTIIGKVYPKKIFVIFYDINFVTTIIYFVVMLLFGWFISRRFNKKLFKFSVTSTLKGGSAK